MCCAVRAADCTGPLLLEEKFFYLTPVIDAPAAADLQVVGSGEQNSISTKAAEVQRLIVYQIISIQNSLIAAEDEMRWRQKWKMAAQPPKLWAEGIGKFHSCRGNKNFV